MARSVMPFLRVVLAVASLAAVRPAPAASPASGEAPRKGTSRSVQAPRRAFAPVRPGPRVPLRPARRRPPAAGEGTVAYVAARRGYLDAGAEEGLAAGRRLAIERRGRPVGSCVVEAVSAHDATCVGGELRAGDTFALGRPPPREPGPATRIPPALTAAETVRRRAVLDSAPVAKVEYVARPGREGSSSLQRATVSFVHASYLSMDSAAIHQERIEARLAGVEIHPGWRLFLDASGVVRGNSADGARFRPGDSALLEVRELQLAARDPDRALTVALGRVLPWSAPGSTVFDGAQVGWRGRGREVGIFGGAVPDVVTTGVRTSRSTAGAYGSLERATEGTLLHGEGRVAMVRSPELGTRLEVEALGSAWIARKVSLSGQARLGFGDRTAPASFDSARIDLSARLAEPLWVIGSCRYVGLLVEDPAAVALFPGPARHADLTASWDAWRLLTVRATGGYARDLTSGLDRQYVGPEIAMPRLFGRYGGVSAGWLEERGWAEGRSVWLQAQGDSARGLRGLLRASLFMDSRPAPLSDESTLGLVASVSTDLASWLRFRFSSLARIELWPGSATDTLGGLSLLAALEGSH